MKDYEKILLILSEGNNDIKSIAELMEWNEQTVRNVISKLVTDGYVRRVNRGNYDLTEKGIEYIMNNILILTARDTQIIDSSKIELRFLSYADTLINKPSFLEPFVYPLRMLKPDTRLRTVARALERGYYYPLTYAEKNDIACSFLNLKNRDDIEYIKNDNDARHIVTSAFWITHKNFDTLDEEIKQVIKEVADVINKYRYKRFRPIESIRVHRIYVSVSLPIHERVKYGLGKREL
ncbi:MAG: hypothetical protein KatS3mg003_1744 [Candidatus Nitrosocaldaceae archaeon]|nr:MAG: hypothetical protein KatS3mg003_1744 [Candidatus Nitrosocaldaceae archaeon]